MTTGQRIALKRKELGLSQEALGEKLGVSRQAIYKWESDSALPEIEKLISLSRLFGISVGALLGVEEEAAASTEASSELTEAQLKMVEEISRRYVEVPHKPPRRWLLPLLGLLLAVIALLMALISVTRRLDRMDSQYRNLQSSIQSVSGTVNGQMASITSQVEELLKEQNSLTSDYAAQVVEVDKRENNVTFSFRATPKIFTEGTVAYIEAESGTDTQTFGPFLPIDDQTFIGEVETVLSDNIRLSVIFETEGVRFTQLLGEFTGLWSESCPHIEAEYLGGILVYRAGMEPNHCFLEHAYTYLTEPLPEEVAECRFGVFLNRQLLAWAGSTPVEAPEDYVGSGMEFTNYIFYPIPYLTIPYEWGDELCIAALITDCYGRQSIQIIESWELQTNERGHCEPRTIAIAGWNHLAPEDWVLE